MMLKLAQLETLCELQQAELETLRKTVKGLAEHVDHPDSVASLVQKDEKARMQETQQTLKRVLAKHARQHKNKDFHPKASRQNYRPADAKPESPKHAGEAGASDRAELLAEGAQQSGSKGSQRFDPVHWAKHRYEARTGFLKAYLVVSKAISGCYAVSLCLSTENCKDYCQAGLVVLNV